jgi:hypothetical protein
MRIIGTLSLIVAGAWLAPAAAFAHPGPHHGDAAWSLRHVLSNSDHLLLIGVGVAIALGSAALFALQAQR